VSDRKVFLVGFGEVHTIGELQPRDLAGVKLHFQVGRQNGDMNRLAFGGAGALGANTVQLHVAVVGLHEFVDDRVHGPYCSLVVENRESLKDLREVLGIL
jgi:hypothetical protein